MRVYAQIKNDKVVCLIESVIRPEFTSDIEIVEVTDVKGIQEGSLYDRDSETFSNLDENIASPPSIEEEILFETKYQTMVLEMGGM